MTSEPIVRDYRLALSSLLEDGPRPLRDVVVTDISQDSRRVIARRRVSRLPGPQRRTALRICAVRPSSAAPPPCCGNRLPASRRRRFQRRSSVSPFRALRARSGRARRPFLPQAFRRPAGSPVSPAPTARPPPRTCSPRPPMPSDGAARISARSAPAAPGRLAGADLTTPDAVSVHRRLAEARDDGAAMLAMEVSSHALDQGRVGGVRFDTAVFTNLSRDHLDYHGTLEAYAAAKARLFQSAGLRARRDQRAGPLRSRACRDARSRRRGRLVLDRKRAHRGAGHRLDPAVRDADARRRVWCCTSRAAGAPARCVRGSSARSTPRTCLRRSACCSAGACRCSRRSPRSALCQAPPGRMEVFGGGTHPVAHRRLRAHAGCARQASRCGARACARPPATACSAAAAIATPASVRRWARSPRSSRTRSCSPTTIRAPRTPRVDPRADRGRHARARGARS